MGKKIIVGVLICVIFQIHEAAASNKYALVIGNRQYEEAPLRNPENDANDMASLLEELGFLVIKKINIRHQDMEQAIRDFGTRLQPGDTALFYFSGHGLQVDGINYLLPIGTRIDSVDEIKYKAVNANMVLDKLEHAGSQVNIVILDACRNNPFSRFRSLPRGLALMTSPSGTLIAYATSPGNVAYDGQERNSPYTKYLLNAMKKPGRQIEEVFKDVRVAVMAETEKKQVPWESSSLTGEFYFTPQRPSDSTLTFTEEQWGVSLAYNECLLDGDKQTIRRQETNLGNFVCDILKEYYHTDIALYNGGGIRASLPQGFVNIEIFQQMFPFSNTIHVLELSGQELHDVLQHSIQQQGNEKNGGFLQVSGLRFVVNAGKKLSNITINGKLLQRDAIYTVATNNFLATGGDEYHVLANIPQDRRHEKKSLVREAIVEYLLTHYGRTRSISYCDSLHVPTRIIMKK